MEFQSIEARKKELRDALARDIALLREAHLVKMRALEVAAHRRQVRGQRLGNSRLAAEVRFYMDALPIAFNKTDVERALGHVVEGSALHRAYRVLERDGLIRLKETGTGRRAAVYEKTKLDLGRRRTPPTR